MKLQQRKVQCTSYIIKLNKNSKDLPEAGNMYALMYRWLHIYFLCFFLLY